ncbi:hypothetical protein [Piscinibacter gummiphilus]|uniref:DUF1592 domain-containing protein n=1 Tax=Piscinibacter gummiphilus TaxID=946333 RepID=A0ABZ0D3X4_9BURK|nr:hypothetical protein [Piscinibacter gummiphilus]WOB10211.1 hypothetical protein RXV79_09120 [Piscinibacter gummiphilus]
MNSSAAVATAGRRTLEWGASPASSLPARVLQAALAVAAAALSACVSPGAAGTAPSAEAPPAKRASTSRTLPAQAASQLMWSALSQGDYASIDRVLVALHGAYLGDPGDATTAAHIGMTQLWRVSESTRQGRPDPSTLASMANARRFLEESVALDGTDARRQGFRASARLAEGAMHRDASLQRLGAADLQDALQAWPQFNLFVLARNLGGAPAGSKTLQQAIDAMWQAQDLCIGGKLSRSDPDMKPYMRLETREGVNRVCWNSAIAPHNFEGFFLEWGDLLVKSGDVALARRIYANAKHSPAYGTWPHRALLEARIRDADANVARFAAPPDAAAHVPIGRASPIACVSCHQSETP